MTATLGDLTQIPVTTNPVQGLPALGDVMVTLYNQDITNQVYVSYQPWFKAGLGNSIPIQPLTSITISAKRAIYVASTVAGVASLLVLPEGAQAQPSPAQVAAQISLLGLATASNQVAGTAAINNPAYGPATLTRQIAQETNIPNNIAIAGVPLLNASDQFVNTSFSVASGTGNTQGPFTVTKPGYSLLLSCWSGAATNVFARVTMIWKDSGSGLTVNQQSWWLLPGQDNSANLHSIRGQGPTESDNVSIQVFAFNGLIQVTQLLLHQVSIIYPRHDFRTFIQGTYVNGLSGSGSDLQAMILVNQVNNLATGTHATMYAPLYAGRAQIWAQTASNTTDMTLTLNAFTDQSANLPNPPNNIYQAKSDGGGEINDQILIPRAQMQIVQNNGNAATKQLSINITMSDG